MKVEYSENYSFDKIQILKDIFQETLEIIRQKDYVNK